MLGERRLLTVLVLAPVAMALAVASAEVVARGGAWETPCWILPNGRVSTVLGGGEACPLEEGERVHELRTTDGRIVPFEGLSTINGALGPGTTALELHAVDRGKETWRRAVVVELSLETALARVASAFLLSVLLMSLPLLLVWRSAAAAAAPFSILYAAAAVVAVAVICGRQSQLLQQMALVSTILVPGAVVHLSFRFPTERRMLREAPGLRFAPYLVCFVILPTAWAAMVSRPLLWPTARALVLVLLGGAWVLLLLSCLFALRESTFEVQRARARILWYGSLVAPVVPTLAFAPRAAVPGAAATYFAVCVIAMPLPIALAISRYNLFDLDQDVRRWIGRFAYLGTAAGVLTAAVVATVSIESLPSGVAGAPALFAVLFGCLALIEPLRGRTLGLIEAVLSPHFRRLGRLREAFSTSISELQEAGGVARSLAETLEAALQPRSGSVFLGSGSAWKGAHHLSGEGPIDPLLAETALKLLASREMLYLAADEVEQSTARVELETAGVTLLSALRRGGQTFGVVLLGPRRSRVPYTSVDLDFVRGTIAEAALALHNARLAEDLLTSDRRATTGRIALSLVHDMSKELQWIRELSRRLPSRIDDRTRALRDLETITEMASDLSGSLRRFLRRAVHESPASETRPLSTIVDRAVAATARRFGLERIVVDIDADAGGSQVSSDIETVLINLIENGLLAEGSDEPVRISVTLDVEALRIVVCDQGRGLPTNEPERVFELGFTTRGEEGGSGVGLSACREIVRSLGGHLDLSPDPAGGTRATVFLPSPP